MIFLLGIGIVSDRWDEAEPAARCRKPTSLIDIEGDLHKCEFHVCVRCGRGTEPGFSFRFIEAGTTSQGLDCGFAFELVGINHNLQSFVGAGSSSLRWSTALGSQSTRRLIFKPCA